MKSNCSLFVCLALLPTAGCRNAQVQDISEALPYMTLVGRTYKLSREADLVNQYGEKGRYCIEVPLYQGGPDWLVAKVPKGHEVSVLAVKQEIGRTLIGNFPYEEKWAVVSLLDPKHPDKRIQAKIYLDKSDNLPYVEK